MVRPRTARGRGPRLAAALLLTAAGPAAAAPARPAACAAVAPEESLQARLDAAPEGSSLCLAPGSYPGPVRIARRVALFGPRSARIHSTGAGTTVSLEAPGAALLGVTVEGSGRRFDRMDAAVHVSADDVRVEGVAVRGALFGIVAEQSRRVTLRGNEVSGDPARPLGLRGDGIRLWEVRDSRVEANRVTDGRDVVVWYSPGNRIEGNAVERGRYGAHLMYSHDNTIEGNRFVGNVVGIFAMYSRNLAVRRNLLARSRGAAGVGLGAKESGGFEVVENWFVADAVGVYLDTSPLEPSDWNRFERNAFRLCDTAVVFHGTVERNRFADNGFRDNRAQVSVEGRGSAEAAVWTGNGFDDYAGYDLDGDGVGDIPYELRSLSGRLTSRHPALRFFHGSAALALVDLVGRAAPIFRPPLLLRDPRPRMGALRPGWLPEASRAD